MFTVYNVNTSGGKALEALVLQYFNAAVYF